MEATIQGLGRFMKGLAQGRFFFGGGGWVSAFFFKKKVCLWVFGS